MFVLGLNLSFNSAASLWKDEVCIASISEERLTGEKNTKMFPIKAIRTVCDEARIQGYTIDSLTVAYSHYTKLDYDYLKKYNLLPDNLPENPEDFIKDLIERVIDVKVNDIHRVNHHCAHAFSAFAVYGLPKNMDNATILTMDGFGDGISACLTVSNKEVATLPLVKSPALYYQFVTGALGFKEHQHEGKITGIASTYREGYIDRTYCYNSSVAILRHVNFFKSRYSNPDLLMNLSIEETEQADKSNIKDFDWFLRLRKTIYTYVKDEVLSKCDDYRPDNKVTDYPEVIELCIAVQVFVEEVVFDFLINNVTKWTDSIYLAGGMFANVTLNYLFSGYYNHVYISPAMGDEGTAMGAALRCVMDHSSKLDMDKLYGFHPEYIINAGKSLPERGIAADIDDNIKAVHTIVHNPTSGFVFYCRERSEFGPRALMHRSILMSTQHETLQSRLNKLMERNEFMPYAPVMLEDTAEAWFQNYKVFKESCFFMTVALPLKEEKLDNVDSLGFALHIDCTCRIQTVSLDCPCTEQAARLLYHYGQVTNTKHPVLINTSFNRHNAPVCATKDQCLSTWSSIGNLGYITINKE